MKTFLQIPPYRHGLLWLSQTPRLDGFHRHDELEFNLVVSGSGTYLISGQRVPLQANSLIWLFPEQSHLLLEQTADFQMWILVIKPSALRALCVEPWLEPLLAMNPTGSWMRHLAEPQLAQLVALCEAVVGREETAVFFNAGLDYLLLSAWDAFLQSSLVPLPPAVHPAVTQLVRLIYEGKTADSLPELAAAVGMAPETVSRLFKKQTGIGLAQFRNRCRVERFLTIYGHGHQCTMLEAALAAGFGSYAQFYRVFQQAMAVSPADYRRRLKSAPSEKHDESC